MRIVISSLSLVDCSIRVRMPLSTVLLAARDILGPREPLSVGRKSVQDVISHFVVEADSQLATCHSIRPRVYVSTASPPFPLRAGPSAPIQQDPMGVWRGLLGTQNGPSPPLSFESTDEPIRKPAHPPSAPSRSCLARLTHQ